MKIVQRFIGSVVQRFRALSENSSEVQWFSGSVVQRFRALSENSSEVQWFSSSEDSSSALESLSREDSNGVFRFN